jgi:hypothetical protein
VLRDEGGTTNYRDGHSPVFGGAEAHARANRRIRDGGLTPASHSPWMKPPLHTSEVHEGSPHLEEPQGPYIYGALPVTAQSRRAAINRYPGHESAGLDPRSSATGMAGTSCCEILALRGTRRPGPYLPVEKVPALGAHAATGNPGPRTVEFPGRAVIVATNQRWVWRRSS